MKLSNEQINKLAAGFLGIEDWHEYDPCCVDYFCLSCKTDSRLHLHFVNFPDFCTDLNAAQRLVKHVFNIPVAENLKSNRFAYVIFDVLSIDAISLNNNPNLSNRDLVKLYQDITPKALTLAALVAAGKITTEDARESLEEI